MELEQGPLNDEDNDDNFSESGHEEEFMQENYCVTSLPKSNKMFQKKGPFGINELYGKASSLDIIEKSLSEKDQQVLCEEKKKNALAKQNLQKEKLTDTDFLSFMDEEQLLEKNEILEDLEEEEEDFDEDTIFIDSFMQVCLEKKYYSYVNFFSCFFLRLSLEYGWRRRTSCTFLSSKYNRS
jgi:hypothetical protein